MRNVKGILLLIALATLVAPAFGQYYDQRVLSKSFEQADFFFTPNYLNPFGLGGFQRSTPGLLDDPLLDLQISPALVRLDSMSRSYAYLDFRGSRDRNQNQGVYPHYLGYDVARISYPYYYANTRRELEPVVSAAFLFQPMKARPWVVGATYQAIFRDESYYAIPQDIYRANVGLDFAGSRTVAENVPIEDIYLGDDDMHQQGHFANVFTKVALAPTVRLGVRAGLATFDREGASGNENRWQHFGNASTTSFWSNREQRGQDYQHWDLSLGLDVDLAPKTQAGLTLGILRGDVTQDLARRDSSRYATGTVGVGNDWSHYVQSSRDDRAWDHAGGTVYGGAHLRAALGTDRRLTAYYRFQREQVDLDMQSAVLDTSNGNWQNVYNDERYYSENHHRVRDIRAGDGTRQGNIHQLSTTLQWDLDEKTELSFGLNITRRVHRTETAEDVDLELERFYQYYYNGQEYLSAEEQREVKSLVWNFRSASTAFEVPILLQRELSRSVKVLFGVNQQMTQWKITDETLALYEERVVTENAQTVRRTDFGERFREPIERRSDVVTSLLGGLVITPSEDLDVRLLFVPSYGDAPARARIKRYQWWLGFTLHP